MYVIIAVLLKGIEMGRLLDEDDVIKAIEKAMCVDGFRSETGLIHKTTAYEVLKTVPSAQPEPCEDTIDALNESIKHFDDMAEECRRNANIERNDYMDMRDDAAEYKQLSIWLNELKWLRERFQSQPERKHIWYKTYDDGFPSEADQVLVTNGKNFWVDESVSNDVGLEWACFDGCWEDTEWAYFEDLRGISE